MKVYMAINKETGEKWYGRGYVYETIGGLKSAMRTSRWAKNNTVMEHDIYSYELKEGVLEE